MELMHGACVLAQPTIDIVGAQLFAERQVLQLFEMCVLSSFTAVMDGSVNNCFSPVIIQWNKRGSLL